MGGTISVKSELGKGSEFTVLLDFERVEEKQVSKTDAGRDEWAELKGRRILLVEDNAMNTEIARAVLEMRGMTVVCAADGQAGCLAFAESDVGFFDAILMDIRMPVMNGHDASRKIRQMKRADASVVPIIAMSADAFEEDIERSMAAGMNAHIAKPVDPPVLYNKLTELIKPKGEM